MFRAFSIAIGENRLVVRQKLAAHREIYDLLMKMNMLMEDAGLHHGTGPATKKSERNRRGFGAAIPVVGEFGGGFGNFGSGR